ncbi:hypothetical protein AB0B66_08425 [Catellatospora sp. NPDC049111]|uniref:hypothetical protein n=1 Tax=Catellatospora sp. NPDC049111 TaxID=3155271 RepID=UPI003403B592
MPDETTAAGAEHPDAHPQHDEAQRRHRRRRWWLFTATALAVLLCIQPLFADGDDAGSAPSWHPDTTPDGHWSIGAAQPTAGPPSATASPTPAPAPTSAVPTRPAATGPSRSPAPEPLGPADAAGVQDLAAKYCRQHVSGSVATPRADGGWQCVRLLVFVRAVDMDVACADAYGKGAYARTADQDDAYAWRCYRR